jgi:HPt (histidine-containing phosphotransfer) domain-containing protein
MLVVELGLQETLQLFSEFFEEAESRFIHLRKLSYENGQAIEREAHVLKGAAGYFGLACLS